ncbi:hypothetical protein PV08_08198 [Exophiala spinifera]|uniref:Phosphatidylinositol-specific phospholipase C X domain-containing protein n=1 Tax=Exophiala spinifera TaxID=91928 RepID=A0A0D1YDH7_9EURO|nr:uncharacterized protein PV08_08198 [Exophiala spinifera]KIW13011.1 hypothetical protein PV08_08198 [Exophiala spinifera]
MSRSSRAQKPQESTQRWLTGAGEGGYLLLVNATPYTWRKKSIHSDQLAVWRFPRKIKPGSTASVYIEFQQRPGTKRTKTNGYCLYKFKDTRSSAIHIEAEDHPSNITVRLQHFDTPNNPGGSYLPLGWQQDGMVYFVLSGLEGQYSSSNPPRDWMQRNLPKLGERPLHKICMPGTHEAGMGILSRCEALPKDLMARFAQTQSLKILGQLEMGSRYLDIRPCISGGEFWTGHYDGRLGARGQKVSSLVKDINQFTAQCAELIILNLSRGLNFDKEWRHFTQSEWSRLLVELLKLNHRFITSGPEKDNLSLLPLSMFIGEGMAAVVVVVDDPEFGKLSRFHNKGFYLPSQLDIFHEYSDTDDCVTMVQDQVRKMQNFMRTSDKRLFLVSWTLRPNAPNLTQEALRSPDKLQSLDVLDVWKQNNKSIRELAYSANKALWKDLLPNTSRVVFPNIVYIDFMESREYVALVMAINDKLSIEP